MGSVDVWGEITVDEKRGIAYSPVSSAKYELYGGDRPGNSLFADCLLTLDARIGKYLRHFQTVHHGIWVTTLRDATGDGEALRQEGGCGPPASQKGFLYVFNRAMGKPRPIRRASRAQSDVQADMISGGPLTNLPPSPSTDPRQPTGTPHLLFDDPSPQSSASTGRDLDNVKSHLDLPPGTRASTPYRSSSSDVMSSPTT
jgi:quinoprotein glucose dehydrogenase